MWVSAQPEGSGATREVREELWGPDAWPRRTPSTLGAPEEQG